ncbi:MAG: DNA replication complex GINS family protein [Nitrososphaerota archaeon]|jgi:DNA replication factor GINS|nr:DNA replication complex GINS family protein [Nitrososphaerota archaeon]MDG6964542.1 DNA replication complex GINS family protein [Nitrososphaerota archaeon]MDG6975832.1 DNA replication complex GINS family protein [Nitrososphaerota archaeon]MDG7030285.1 DNA replication complex GINS family protein [Nitrososphaerota archaeon]
MPETTLDRLRRTLDSENQSTGLFPLSGDFYSEVSEYSQKLKRSAGAGASEVAVRLAATQTRLIESMVSQLLKVRSRKAIKQNAVLQLLPEERYVCSAEQRFQRRFQTLVDAVSSGQPSFVEFAHATENQRNVTVRFVRHVNELVGLDMRRYGPFEAEDVASIPAASADILIAGGDATEILTRDDV